MKLTILDETGDTVLIDTPTTDGAVKTMTSEEIQTEFDRLIKDGYTPIDDKTDKIFVGRITKTDSLTMLYPTIGG